MRLLLDENVPGDVAAALRGQGHDVAAVAQTHPASLADGAVLALARAEGRVLVTLDRDFGELVFARGAAHAGVVYLRLPGAPGAALTARLVAVLREHGAALEGAGPGAAGRPFLVVTARDVRIR
jgi:predicted nuclease of predicted toxin-antitoxin system